MYRSVESLLPMRAMAFPMLGRLVAPGRARDSSTWWVLLEVWGFKCGTPMVNPCHKSHRVGYLYWPTLSKHARVFFWHHPSARGAPIISPNYGLVLEPPGVTWSARCAGPSVCRFGRSLRAFSGCFADGWWGMELAIDRFLISCCIGLSSFCCCSFNASLKPIVFSRHVFFPVRLTLITNI